MSAKRIGGVDVVHWNPRVSLGTGPISQHLALKSRVNNFGDLLGPLIVERIIAGASKAPSAHRDLLTVGSILHFAKDNSVVWGTGLNGKVPTHLHRFTSLDVRAVRGPKTRAFLRARGIRVPEVYGDPALLLPKLRPDLLAMARQVSRSGTVVIIRNLRDSQEEDLSRLGTIVDPRSGIEQCLEAIVRSDRVISSSLHGVIVAEAFGIPAVLVASPKENPFKYEDYFLGTGRATVNTAPDFHAAMSGTYATPEMVWDAQSLLQAFPYDLWGVPQPFGPDAAHDD